MENFEPCYPGVPCNDLPAPANETGFQCDPCPSGYSGDGIQCLGTDNVDTGHNVISSLVQGPGLYFCKSLHFGGVGREDMLTTLKSSQTGGQLERIRIF